MKRFACIFVFLLGNSMLLAQDCNLILTGQVIDFHDGLPLKDATISFNDSVFTTDNEGNFRITNLCPIAYAFTVKHEDCISQIKTIDIAKISKYDFYLEHHYTDLEQVNISAIKGNAITNSLSEDRLSNKDLEKYSSLSLGDALKQVSGVTSLSTGNMIVKPVIQGLHSSRIIIMNNGVRQEDQEWGEEHAPNVDINAFNQIKIIKGAGALQYGGNAIGGVIVAENKLTTLKDTVFGATQFTASTNGRGTAMSTSVNIGFDQGWSAKAQGTLKYFGDSEAPDYILTNTGHQEQSFSLGAGYSNFQFGTEAYYSFYNTKQGILRASHIGNVGDLIRAIKSDRPLIEEDFTYSVNAPKQETQHHLAKLKAYNRFRNLGKWEIQYALQINQRKEFDIRRGEDRNKASLDLKLLTQTLESSFLFDANESFKKTIGIQVTNQKNTPNPETGVRRLIPDYQEFGAGLFLISEIDLFKNIKADFGIRYDYSYLDAKKFYLKDFWEDRDYDRDFFDIIVQDEGNQWLTNPKFDYHSIAASAGIKYSYGSENIFLFNASYAMRAPNPTELFSDGLHHSAAIIELGKLDLDQEKALKFSLTSEHNNIFNLLSLKVAPYISQIQDYKLLEPTGLELTVRGAFPVWEYRQTNALLYGLDIDVTANFSKKWSASSAFSYIRGQDQALDENLPLMPAPVIRSSLSYSLAKFQFSLINVTAMEQKDFPDTNFEVEYVDANSIQRDLVDISSPPPGYTLFDFDINYTMSLKNPKDLTLGLSINNTFNTTYREYLNRQRYYTDALGRNISVHFNFKF
ncbi:TonB-dependent receptor [Aquimarina sp. W85]|uniref:TonB-dependent receptor n=1 Tax=Aquimarina rhodophyticola TaxID=3342246 RepID=UPI00366CCC1C